jgi:hypothetical protein
MPPESSDGMEEMLQIKGNSAPPQLAPLPESPQDPKDLKEQPNKATGLVVY